MRPRISTDDWSVPLPSGSHCGTVMPLNTAVVWGRLTRSIFIWATSLFIAVVILLYKAGLRVFTNGAASVSAWKARHDHQVGVLMLVAPVALICPVAVSKKL